MNRRRICKQPSRLSHLCLQPLEDRCTPASAVYSSATQTLTVTAVNNDQVWITPVPGDPVGRITVTDNATVVFDSSTEDRTVRNLVVRFNGVDTGWLQTTGRLVHGNFTVFGARVLQNWNSMTQIGGNVRYVGSPNGLDNLTFWADTDIGGNFALTPGGGTNNIHLHGGNVDGNLSMIGGEDTDTVNLLAGGDYHVGGAVSIRLGEGTNEIDVAAPNLFAIGKSLTCVGGTGRDYFLFDSAAAVLQVTGNARFVLGEALPAMTNLLTLGFTSVGGNLTVKGGNGSDTIKNYKNMIVAGGFAAQLGGGQNYLNFSQFGGAANSIAGSLSYVGGPGRDQIYVDGTSIGLSARFVLGESSDNDQLLRIGHGDSDGVQVHRSLKVTASSSDDDIGLRRLYVGRDLSLNTGDGQDQVRIDDVEVNGVTAIDLGGGNDTLEIEMVATDGLGLDGVTTF
jgi:hypothetical protein